MMLNEKIALKMGWKIDKKSKCYINEYGQVQTPIRVFIPYFSIADAKLLQQKMVDDGWNIIIENDKYSRFIIHGKKDEIKITLGYFSAEPAAIVNLFCKVYGLEVIDEPK